MSELPSRLLPLRIRLPYTTEDEFIDKYGSNVGRGGIFVATRAPKPEGSGLAFEFVLADGARVLRGEGVVVKAQGDTGGGRAGMTVRFVKLDAASKALVDRVVARRGGADTASTREEMDSATVGGASEPVAKPSPPTSAQARGVSARPTPSTPPPGLVRRVPVATPVPAVEPASGDVATSETPGSTPLFPETPSDAPPASSDVAASEPPEQAPLFPPDVEATSGEASPRTSAEENDGPAANSFADTDSAPADVVVPAPAGHAATTDSDEPSFDALVAALESATDEEAAARERHREASALVTSGSQATAHSATSPPPATPPGTEASTAPASAAEATASAPTTTEPAPGAGPSTTKPVHGAEPSTTAEPAPSAEPTTTAEPAPSAEPSTPTAEPAPSARTEPPAPSTSEAPPTPEPTSTSEAEAARNRRRVVLDVPTPPSWPSPSGPEIILGIDLGTSQARVAIFQDGTARLVPIPGTQATGLPALIAVDSGGELLVGAAAQIEASRAPRRATSGLQQLLGLRARSPRLKALTARLPFPVAADPSGDAAVELGGRVVPPTLFAALQLRELRHAASELLGRKVTRAVLCAPTYATERERTALREAATLAGLDVRRVLTAPAAAALAYGHGRGLARKRVLVVDLGGGGLDVCVVQVTGDDLEVVTTGGDPAIGGVDFDARLAEALASDLSAQGIPRPEHALDWGPLRSAAEATKVALSEKDPVDVALPAGTVPAFTRERVEALTADLAQRVTTVVREVLESNALSPQSLDAVLLVGGQSRAPLVRRRLEESLGVSVRDDVDPQGAVALGAALLGHALLLAEAGKPAASVSEVLTAPIGVAERGGNLHRVLERNTRLPAEKTLALPVTPGPLELALFQGPSPSVHDDEYLGRLSLTVERPGEAELHFSLSADGTLSLAATLPGAKRQPVPLATEDLDDAGRSALLARSPLSTEPEARPGGLLSGLKKLFGRR